MSVPSAESTWTPASYVSPSSFTETDVHFPSKNDGTQLDGTLSVPKGDSANAKFPAVVILQGSGGADRDGTFGDSKGYKDLALGLSSLGVAVLRYDKPHVGKQLKDLTNPTIEREYVNPALGALEFLSKTPSIDMEHIFVFGHSQGGSMAPMVVRAALGAGFNVKGMVLLAASARTLQAVYLHQGREMGAKYADNPEILAKIKEIFANADAEVALVESPELTTDTPNDKLPFQIPASYWISLRGYTPVEAAGSLISEFASPRGLDTFVGQGGKDLQVTTELDFEPFKRALEGEKSVTLKVWDNLNHVFSSNHNTDAMGGYVGLHHVEQVVVNDLRAWMKEREQS